MHLKIICVIITLLKLFKNISLEIKTYTNIPAYYEMIENTLKT